jgi:hypothetical protein
MHLNFAFSARQILWTLSFAAQLVLLVVLLGRDRIRRYPLFTLSIVLFTLRLLAEVLLSGRMPVISLQAIFISLADLAVIVDLLVVAEVAWHAFEGARLRTWLIGSVTLLALGGAVVWQWGPWPAWQQLSWGTLLGKLQLMQLLAQKGDTLVDVVTVGTGLLVVLFGSRFKAGWRTHTQKIAIGLSTAAIAWLTIQGVWQVVAKTVHPQTQQEYERVMGLGGKLVNANKVVFIAVLVWWILWLWLDEPGAAAKATPDAVLVAETPSLADHAVEEEQQQ